MTDKQTIATQNKLTKGLIKRLEQKDKLIEALSERLKQQDGLLKQTLAQIEELKTQLQSNSENSNKPPSSDGLNKKPAIPRKKGGKRGGKKGHKGRKLDFVETPDKVVTLVGIVCRMRRWSQPLKAAKVSSPNRLAPRRRTATAFVPGP